MTKKVWLSLAELQVAEAVRLAARDGQAFTRTSWDKGPPPSNITITALEARLVAEAAGNIERTSDGNQDRNPPRS
jgi:hypothetical protein